MAVCNESQEVVGLQDVLPRSSGSNLFRHVGDISTFVSLAVHRQGIGRRLSKATFQQARQQGFLKLIATIRADNPAAISFYQSLGFRLIGTAQKHAFVGSRYIDEILAERLIDQGCPWPGC